MSRKRRRWASIALFIMAILLAALLLFGQDLLDKWKAERTQSEVRALYDSGGSD